MERSPTIAFRLALELTDFERNRGNLQAVQKVVLSHTTWLWPFFVISWVENLCKCHMSTYGSRCYGSSTGYGKAFCIEAVLHEGSYCCRPADVHNSWDQLSHLLTENESFRSFYFKEFFLSLCLECPWPLPQSKQDSDSLNKYNRNLVYCICCFIFLIIGRLF